MQRLHLGKKNSEKKIFLFQNIALIFLKNLLYKGVSTYTWPIWLYRIHIFNPKIIKPKNIDRKILENSNYSCIIVEVTFDIFRPIS